MCIHTTLCRYITLTPSHKNGQDHTLTVHLLAGESEREIDAFLCKALAELADVLLGEPLKTQQELQKRISSLTLTPVVHKGEPAFAVGGDVTLFCAEEVMMLLSSGTMTGEHHPFVISLDGLMLKLRSRAAVIAIVLPRTEQTDGVSIRQPFEAVEDCLLQAA